VDTNEILNLARAHASETLKGSLLAALERQFGSAVVDLPPSVRRRGRSLLPTFSKAGRVRDWVRLPSAAGRLPFLAACRSFLRKKHNEWIILGLGMSTGSRASLAEVFVAEGGANSAALPVSVQAAVRGHIEQHPKSLVLHVHNHPSGIMRDIKNLFLGEGPLPSTADRTALYDHRLVASEANLEGGLRCTRFYLVENGIVHEYKLPPWSEIQAAWARLCGWVARR
jgi:hypothetical protein